MFEPGEAQTGGPEAGHDLSGTTVGRFTVDARLGVGGMGEVYRALDTKLRRTVALKRLAPRLRANESFRRRFLKEAENASALTDPRVAAIYDVLEEGEEIFLVMEYVEGPTLRKLMEEPLSVGQFLDIAEDCIGGVAAAHERGIVHHDIKPENIIFTPSHRVKILDFGVARQLPPEDGVTSTEPLQATQGTLFGGTPAYMAPEVLLAQDADGRSDIFALGIVFYEMLARRHPFRANNVVATVDNILHQTPPPLDQVNPEVPQEIARLIARMLAKDREQRPTGAPALLEEFQTLRAIIGKERTAGYLIRKLLQIGAMIAAVALLLLGIQILAPSTVRTVRHFIGFDSIPAKKHLVVLPFLNVGEDPANRRFCDGLVETLTNKLGELEQFQEALRVISASDVRRERIVSPREARISFGVPLAVTGSIQRTGDKGLVTVALVDTITQIQLRSRTIPFQSAGLPRLQDSVVNVVVDLLELELHPLARRVLAAGNTPVASAYDLYLRGRGLLQRYDKPENLDSAIRMFKQALEQDPKYALALAGSAEAFWHKFDLTRDAHLLERAQEDCSAAINLNPNLVEVHVTMGVIHRLRGRYEEAVREFQRAIQLDPYSESAYRELGNAYETIGKLPEAELTFKKAVDLKPGSWSSLNHLGAFYSNHGRFPEAELLHRRVIALTPDNAVGYSNLGALYFRWGRNEEAARFLAQSIAINPTSDAYSNLGTVYYYLGRYSDAVDMFEKAVRFGEGNYLLWGNLGDAYRRTPQNESKATDAYRKAIELAEQQLNVNLNDALLRARLAVYWAKLGNKDMALAQIEEALKLAPADPGIFFRASLAYELSGKRQQALNALDTAVKRGYSLDEIRKAPNLAELRNDPRYLKLMEGRPSVR